MNNLDKLYLKDATEQEQLEMEEDEFMLEEKKLEERWQKYVTEMKIDKEQMITMLADAAALRGKKKKRGKGKGKGKGKKKK